MEKFITLHQHSSTSIEMWILTNSPARFLKATSKEGFWRQFISRLAI